MQALYYLGSSKLQWRETPDATIQSPTDAIIRPLAVAACDLDRNIVSGRSPFPGAFVLGHEFSGIVSDIGAEVTGLKRGDIVLASFQPSCGACGSCSHGFSSVCNEVPNTSMYGIGAAGGDWSGALADLIRVPWAEFNLRKLPDDIDPVSLASGSDNLADGLRGVDKPLSDRPGASVLVAGAGSVALYSLLCAKFLGAEKITFASQDRVALEIAEKMGIDCLEVEKWPRKLSSHLITMDCTNDVEGLACTISSTAPYGFCTSASIYFAPKTPIPMGNMYMKGIQLHTGRVNSASQLDRVLQLVSEGLDPNEIDPKICSMTDAIEALHTVPVSQKLILTSEVASST